MATQASRVKGKDKNAILDELATTAQPGSSIHEQQKSAIIVRCTEDIEASLESVRYQLEESSKASDRLSNKILWLNVVLALATVVGAIATIVITFKT